MQIARFNEDRLGLVDEGRVRDVSKALEVLPESRWPRPPGDELIVNLAEVGRRVTEIEDECPMTDVDSVTLGSPVANPSKIIGVPINYHEHIEEIYQSPAMLAAMGGEVKPIEYYGLFMKAASSLIGAGDGVSMRFLERRHDHEVELAVVISRRARQVRAEDALDYVAGYAIGLDLTMRGTEDRSLRKSLDGYSVLGPWLVTADEVANPNKLDIQLRVNATCRQSANTSGMVLSVEQCVEYASSFFDLLPGDVIMTGTPGGVGPIRPGDVVSASIEGIGSMELAILD